jgi:hypothetical protein
MDDAWLHQTSDELRRQAALYRRLAAQVLDRELGRHLEQQAAKLLAAAERKSAD